MTSYKKKMTATFASAGSGTLVHERMWQLVTWLPLLKASLALFSCLDYTCSVCAVSRNKK